MLGDRLHDAVRLAAQRERIFRSAGDETEREHSGDRVGLIGDRENRALHRRAERRPPSTRACNDRRWPAKSASLHVGLHVLIELLHARVKAADNSLQFGEFLDQFRGQIGFGQQRSFVDDAGSNGHAALLHRLGQPTGHALHAHRLVVVAAEIFLERNVAQQIDALAEGLLLVRLPEKARIVEAGAQNAFVAVPD